MEQVSKFCRALLPADPFQALFLFGVVLISFSRQLGWYSKPLIFKYVQSDFALQGFTNFMTLAVLPTVFAGCAGYFVCFWPGKHPLRRTVVAVLLPALIGLALVFFDYASLAVPPVSVLYRNRSYFPTAATMANNWMLFPTAFYACLLGAILVFVFVLRLVKGKSDLPLGFPESYERGEVGQELSKRTSVLIFAMLECIAESFSPRQFGEPMNFICGIMPDTRFRTS